jgi:hypothetical protein
MLKSSPVELELRFQVSILAGKQSGSQTHIAGTESVSLWDRQQKAK